jgi:hypothetical protein
LVALQALTAALKRRGSCDFALDEAPPLSRRRFREPRDPDRKLPGVGYIYVLSTRGGEYVGSTLYTDARWAQHRRALEKDRHSSRGLQGAYDRGHAVSFDVIEVVKSPTLRRLIEREQWHFDRRAPRYNSCRPG